MGSTPRNFGELWPTSDRVAGGGGTYRDHTLRHEYLRKRCQGVGSGSGDKGEGSGAERPELMAAQRKLKDK